MYVILKFIFFFIGFSIMNSHLVAHISLNNTNLFIVSWFRKIRKLFLFSFFLFPYDGYQKFFALEIRLFGLLRFYYIYCGPSTANTNESANCISLLIISDTKGRVQSLHHEISRKLLHKTYSFLKHYFLSHDPHLRE